MKNKISIIPAIFFALIGIACLVGWLTGFGNSGGPCPQKKHYSKAIVKNIVISKDSLNYDLAYKKNHTSVISKSDTLWGHYNRNSFNETEISNLLKIKNKRYYYVCKFRNFIRQ